MISSRCIVVRNAANAVVLIPLDHVAKVEYTAARPNVPHGFNETLEIRLLDGEHLTLESTQATAAWKNLCLAFHVEAILELDGTLTAGNGTPPSL